MVASSGCNFSFRSDSFNLDHLSFACTRKRVCYSEKVSFGSSEDARIKYSPTPSRSLCGFCQRMDSEFLSLFWGKTSDFWVSYHFLLCWQICYWSRYLVPLPFCIFIIAHCFVFVNRFFKNIWDFLCIFIRLICNQFDDYWMLTRNFYFHTLLDFRTTKEDRIAAILFFYIKLI